MDIRIQGTIAVQSDQVVGDAEEALIAEATQAATALAQGMMPGKDLVDAPLGFTALKVQSIQAALGIKRHGMIEGTQTLSPEE